MRKTWDFFISYASEDRAAAANPIEEELTNRGFAVWLDHKVLSEAGKLVEEIHAGLSNCHYGIIILSPRFLSKDWPMRELDTLFAIESIEGRRRIVPLLHNMTLPELQDRAPELHKKTPIRTGIGVKLVCDQILDRVLHNTDRKMQASLGELGTKDLPRFRAPGLLRCGNESCTWRAPAEWPDFLGAAGPEFTFRKVGGKWCIVS
jgi:hypothetical protein